VVTVYAIRQPSYVIQLTMNTAFIYTVSQNDPNLKWYSWTL